MPKTAGLSPKERAFIREYTRDRNATRSAIAAGYSPKTAAQIGYQLLQKTSVGAALAKREARLADQAEISAKEIIERLTVLARADMGDVAQWDEDGLRLLPSEEIDTRVIAQVTQTEKFIKVLKDGEDGREVLLSREKIVKLHDPKTALKLLGDHLGVFPSGKDGASGGAGDEMLGAKAYSQEDWQKLP